MKFMSNGYISNLGLSSVTIRLLAPIALLITMLFGFGCPPPPPPAPAPTAHDINSRICLARANGVPGSTPTPSIDGAVDGDLGWNNSFRYIFENGSTAADGAFQAIHDGTFLYLSFEAYKDPTFDDKDVAVIAIDPAGAAGDYRRIHIFPFAPATTGSATNQPPAGIKYWKGDPGAWGVSQPALPGASSEVKVKRVDAGANSKWSVEVKLPLADFNIPVANYFGLYSSLFKVDKSQIDPMTGNFVYSENRWPQNATLTDGGVSGGNPFADLEVGTPVKDKWGNATRGSAICNGVFISPSDITTDKSPNYVISLNKPTTFSVNVHNSSQDASSNFVNANGVQATFKLADFGLPSQWNSIAPPRWTQIGSLGNPTAAANIPANGSLSLSTGGWQPTNPADYNTAGTRHQCMLVELNSGVSNTLFVNRSSWSNMEFQMTASPFDETVTVGTEGYELPGGQNTHQIILREYRYNTEKEEKWDSKVSRISKKADQVYWLEARPGEKVQLVNTVTPPNIKIPSTFIDIPPDTNAAERKQVRLPVRPGNLLTIIADRTGSIGIGKIGPPSKLLKSDVTVPTDPFPSPTRPFPTPITPSPSPTTPTRGEPIGMLVGSWDGFEKNRFTISGSKSLKVPNNAQALSLSIEYPQEKRPDLSVEGFRAQVIETPLKPIYTELTSMVTRDPTVEDLRLPLGINIPTWVMCGQRRTGRVLTINGERFSEMQSIGCYGYMIRSIGPMR